MKRKKNNYASVTVEWEGCLCLEEVLKLDDMDKDLGVYQIYGTHIIFGKKALLYIGKTDQTFSQRFRYEHVGWLKEEEDVSIHVGRIVKVDQTLKRDISPCDLRKIIKDTEALTIKRHSPPYNSDNIGTYNGQRLEVVNQGEYGSLEDRYKSRDRKRWGYSGDYS